MFPSGDRRRPVFVGFLVVSFDEILQDQMKTETIIMFSDQLAEGGKVCVVCDAHLKHTSIRNVAFCSG